jgi:uncharacterized repeat protein (TIGR01451 family)
VDAGAGVTTNNATAGSPVTIALRCASSTLPGFTGTTNASWPILRGGSLVGHAADKFAFDFAGFAAPQHMFGAFSVSNNAGDLFLSFEPYTNEVDLGVTLSASTNVVYYNQLITYTIVVTNQSAEVSAGYVVSNALPAGFSFASCSAGGAHSAGVVTWILGGLASGSYTTLTATATNVVTSAGIFSDIVTVTPNQADPATGNNSATNTVNASNQIPTLSEWGLIILAALLLIAGGWRLSRPQAEGPPPTPA